jgi:hypothetical protein
MNGGKVNGERIMRMRKNGKIGILFGACLAAWCLAVTVPSLSLAAPDSDGDGVANNKDQCGETPQDDIPFGVDSNGCTDADGDGVFGYIDQCPLTPTGETADSNGCSASQVDSDGDGYIADDCGPLDPAVYPGATELCDGTDNNCDGTVDEGCGGGPVDSDGDGFPDSVEQAGITLPAGMTLADGTTSFLPACNGGERALCVDQSSPDVFIIVSRSEGCPASNACGEPCSPLFNIDGDAESDSNIPLPASYPAAYAPFDPLSAIGSGLGVTTHEVLQSGDGSQEISGHFAVKINEDLDPCTGSMLGLSTPGVPAEGVQATVFTESIIKWINDVCSEVCITPRRGSPTCYTPDHPDVTSFLCKDGISNETVDVSMPGASLEPIYYRLIPNIIVHEFGHMIDLATGNQASGYHLAGVTGYFMEQSVESKGTFKNGVVTQTIYISDDFHPDSIGGYQLK